MEPKMNETCNACDYTLRIDQFKRGKDLVYGKERIKSYEYYGLLSSTDLDKDMSKYNLQRIYYIYSLFLYNLKVLTNAGLFKVNWLTPNYLVTATKGIFWDWNNNEEFNTVKNSAKRNGFYFPIFILPEGIPHNQIEDIDMTGKYNAYNGNHRIDIAKYLYEHDRESYNTAFDSKGLMCIEIPAFCEKSCTGFRYTPIKYDVNGPVDIPENQQFDPIDLYMLRYTNEEMKIDIMEYEKENRDLPLCEGVDLVKVRDYQVAFRILQAFQNVLEYPLTQYYKEFNELPETIINQSKAVNNFDYWNGFYVSYDKGKIVCPCSFPSGIICSMLDVPRQFDCDLMICCNRCQDVATCSRRCTLSCVCDVKET